MRVRKTADFKHIKSLFGFHYKLTYSLSRERLFSSNLSSSSYLSNKMYLMFGNQPIMWGVCRRNKKRLRIGIAFDLIEILCNPVWIANEKRIWWALSSFYSYIRLQTYARTSNAMSIMMMTSNGDINEYKTPLLMHFFVEQIQWKSLKLFYSFAYRQYMFVSTSNSCRKDDKGRQKNCY